MELREFILVEKLKYMHNYFIICSFHALVKNYSYLEYYLLQLPLDFIQYSFFICRFILLCLHERIVVMKENGQQLILCKTEMMFVGSRELSNGMENGHIFVKMLPCFLESITLWQMNSSFCKLPVTLEKLKHQLRFKF